MFNKKSILKFEVISTIVIMVLGVILHFTYEWSGNNILVGILSPINESVWEHLKLIFTPMILTLIIGYFYEGKNYDNYICSKTLGIISAMIFIVFAFYTYTGIIGTNIDFINITLFFVAVILGQYISYKNIISNKPCNLKIAITFLIIIAILFIYFTFNPPNIELFRPPVI